MAGLEGLPPGWVRVRDGSSGETYYWHEESDQVTWEKPALGTTGAKRLLTTHAILDGSRIRKMEWLDDWMEREELFLDVIWPQGANPALGMASLIEHAWRCSSSEWDVFQESEDGVTIRSGIVSGLPVFSSEWAFNEHNATLQRFLEYNLSSEQEIAFDERFISAEYLTTFGSLDRLEQPFAQLVRYRYSVPSPMEQREKLYLAIQSVREDRSAAIIAYISVHSPRFPPEPGFTRARTLSPSFDHATVLPESGGLRLRRVGTTDMGSLMPDWLWNSVGRYQRLGASLEEARRMREAVAGGIADEANWGLAWHSQEGQIMAVRGATPAGLSAVASAAELVDRLAYLPGSWAKSEMERYTGNKPKADLNPNTLGAASGVVSSVTPDAWAFEEQKKRSTHKPSPMRNRFSLMSGKDTKASAKIDTAGHYTIDAWQMDDQIKSKKHTQGAIKNEHVGVKGTVNLQDYMVKESLAYQKNTKPFPLHVGPLKGDYEGIKPTIPLNDFLIAEQRAQRDEAVQAEKFQSLPAPQIGTDTYLADHYKQAAVLASSATQHSWTEIDRRHEDANPMAC